MKTQEAIDHFKTRAALAKRLGIKPSAISQWGEYPPELRQHQIENLTAGKLKVEQIPVDPSTEAA